MSGVTETLRIENFCTAVLLNLEKASNTVHREILLKKLEERGFCRLVLEWIKFYLSHLTYSVCIIE